MTGTGPIPQTLGNLKALTVLGLQRNELSGEKLTSLSRRVACILAPSNGVGDGNMTLAESTRSNVIIISITVPQVAT